MAVEEGSIRRPRGALHGRKHPLVAADLDEEVREVLPRVRRRVEAPLGVLDLVLARPDVRPSILA